MNFLKIVAAALALSTFSTPAAFAGGVSSSVQVRQQHAYHNRALYEMESEAMSLVEQQFTARKAKVVAVPVMQDKYGDPMYAAYGPLPYGKGDPMYVGPRYAASFSRPYAQPMPDGEYRGYARGAFSNPGLTAQTDVSLGVATNSSYLQQGMQVAPGSMAPSAARAMINNP